MKRAALAALLVCSIAHADPASDFRDAQGNIDALERLGAGTTAWNDDAFVEAARLAERANDPARARRDLEQAIAISRDAVLVQRARGDLARIAAFADWGAVSAEHERLLPTVNNAGDPRAALRQLERLALDHPGYPRAPMLMTEIAVGWEREGDGDRALDWLARARAAATSPADRMRTSAEYVRTLIRLGELSTAERELAHLAGAPANLHDQLADAKLRRTIRWAMWGVLVAIAALATWALRGRYRRLLRPPTEVLFMVPIGIVLVVVSATGNPLVARAIRWIIAAGIAIAWIAGTIEAKRRWLSISLTVLAVAAATYIAIDRGPLVDLLRQTWRER